MTTTWWNRGQAKAWVVWRDDKLVELVGSHADITFQRLHDEFKLLLRARARYNAPVRPETAFPTTADEIIKAHSRLFPPNAKRAGRALRAAISSGGRYSCAPLRSEIPQTFGTPAELDAACADERLTAYGRFDSGKRETVPPEEFADGDPKGWTNIVYKAADLRLVFPSPTAAKNDGLETTSRAATKLASISQFAAAFIDKERGAGREPRQSGLEKAWHNAGRTGHRDALRAAFKEQLAAAGKFVRVGRPKKLAI
jgi:hypothetical protein